MGETNKTPEFLAKYPLGKAPTFSSSDGVHLFESNTIAQYVAEGGPAKDQLLGSTPAERAVISQWTQMAETEVAPPLVQCLLPRVGFAPYNEEVDVKALANTERVLGAMESHLAGRTWLATANKLSLADIAVASSLRYGFTYCIDAEMRAKYPGIMDWFRNVTSSEGVKEAFGEIKFIEKREVPK